MPYQSNFVSQIHGQGVLAACLTILVLSGPHVQADGLYEVRSGTFRTIGGIAGILDFELPNIRQSFVRLETDDVTNLATMQILDENMFPIDLFGVGTDFENGVLENGVYSFFDDTLIAPFDTRGTLDYLVDATDPNQLIISGTFHSTPSICCDIIQAYEHSSVVASRLGGLILGDFNQDTRLDVADVELLIAEMQTEVPDLKYDLTRDDLVDRLDLDAWVKDLKFSWYGDANLDGEFNTNDLIAVFQAGTYDQDMTATWSQGDWTGDQRFDSSDLVAAFQDGGFEQGPRTAVNTVPDPSSAIPALLAFFGIGRFCLRKRRER